MTLWRHTVTSVCGGDVASHRFPLFRCLTAHTSVRGEQPWRAVADPRHSVSWLCGQDLSTRAIVADRWGCGFILRVHSQTENVRCIAKWRGSTHSHGRLCGEGHSRHRHAQQASVCRHSVADTKSLVCAPPGLIHPKINIKDFGSWQ